MSYSEYQKEYNQRPEVIERRRNGKQKYHFKRKTPVWNKGITGYTTTWKGRKHDEETKKKMSEKWTPERKEKYLYNENNPHPNKRGSEHHRWKGGKKLKYARHDAKRREFGFIPINDKFVGSEAHHIDKMHIVHIPKILHRSVWHSLNKKDTMEQINTKIFCWILGKPIEDLIS